MGAGKVCIGTKLCLRYKCPRHKGKNLVLSRLEDSRGRVTEFFCCPVRGCLFSKPNKWQNRRAKNAQDVSHHD